jgi:CO/xanthine dehydrogenase FAD-binding subunit
VALTAYARPTDLDEALRLVSLGDWRLLAGGTDVYPTAGRQLSGQVLDLTGIAGLTGISTNGGLRIGAATSWADIAGADLPPALQALQQAAGMVGGRQIQVAGTIGGNLCNASPAADGVPPLLALDAEVTLASVQGVRRLPLAAFLTGPRQTALRPGEVLTEVVIPQSALKGRSSFAKLGARRHLVISITMVAVRLVVNAGQLTQAAIAVGACSAVARRLPLVEAALVGAALDGATPAGAASRVKASDVLAELSPIDDIRATAAYRRDAAVELVRRTIAAALQ